MLTPELRALVLRGLQARALVYLRTRLPTPLGSMGSLEWILLRSVLPSSGLSPQIDLHNTAARVMGNKTDPLMIPADEVERYEPENRFDNFYLACMVRIGDPERTPLAAWAPDFHDYAGQYFDGACHEHVREPRDVPHSSVLLLQYILWYQRESRRVKTENSRGKGPL